MGHLLSTRSTMNRGRSRFSSSARSAFSSFGGSSSSSGARSFGGASQGFFSSSAKPSGASFGAGFGSSSSSSGRTPFTSIPRNIMRGEKRGLSFAQREFLVDALGRPLVVSGVVQFGSLTLGSSSRRRRVKK